MRILHCSDIHLGRRPVGAVGDFSQTRFDDYFNAFSYIIDYAIDNNIQLLMIAGDFFDKRELSPDILLKAENLLARLKAENIAALITEGNHDNVMLGYEKDSWIVYLTQKGLLQRPYCSFNDDEYQFFPVIIDDCNFYGLGYTGSYTKDTIEALSNHLDSSDDKSKNIVMIHTAIAGDDKVSGTVNAEVMKMLEGKAIYVAGGHLHSYRSFPSENPFFHIPGSLEYFDLGEIGQRKGFIVFDTDSQKFDWFPSNVRKALKIKIRFDGNNFDEFKAFFIEEINKHKFEKDMLVLCDIHLKKNFYVDVAFCDSEFASREVLKASIRIFPAGNDISDAIYSNYYSVAKLEKNIIDDWQFFGEQSEMTTKSLQILKTTQRENNEDDFIEEFDALLSNILNIKTSKI